MRSLSQWQKGLGLILGEATMTQTDQMNEMSFRSDEQAQSQDRERLQDDLSTAWHRVVGSLQMNQINALESELRLLRWALGLGS
jgi:hypothetical protein